MNKSGEFKYIRAGDALVARIGREWGEKFARHMHAGEAGFSIAAMHGDQAVGLISVCWRELPPPLHGALEGYIDIIEVAAAYRRQGIGRRLVELAADEAHARGACQLRAWSSQDKVEAIPMWKALGFGLCPATTYPGGQPVEGFFVTRVFVNL